MPDIKTVLASNIVNIENGAKDRCNYRVELPFRRKVLQSMFWEVPMADWLICSYLLPRQALATHVEKHDKTLRLIGSPALYCIDSSDRST